MRREGAGWGRFNHRRQLPPDPPPPLPSLAQLDHAPEYSKFLMEPMVDQQRLRALQTMLKGYRPGPLNVGFAATNLGFNGKDDDSDAAACEEWLESGGVKLLRKDGAETMIDTKTTVLNVETLGKPPATDE